MRDINFLYKVARTLLNVPNELPENNNWKSNDFLITGDHLHKNEILSSVRLSYSTVITFTE